MESCVCVFVCMCIDINVCTCIYMCMYFLLLGPRGNRTKRWPLQLKLKGQSPEHYCYTVDFFLLFLFRTHFLDFLKIIQIFRDISHEKQRMNGRR